MGGVEGARTILGVAFLIIGVACTLAAIILISYGMYPYELTVLYFEMTCMTAGFMGILLGLEVFRFPPSDKRSERNSIIFNMILSVCLAILLVLTAFFFSGAYLHDDSVSKPSELYGDTAALLFHITYFIGLGSAVLFLIAFLDLIYLLNKNKK